MSEKNKVEAVLFASGRSMDEETLAESTGLKIKEVQTSLQALKEDYNSRDTALFIWNEGSRWKINVKEEYSELIKNIAAETEMSRPVMATLALIAQRSPVLQSEVIKSRGAGAYEHIAELVDKEFVTKEKFQRSYKLKLAEKFFNYFDVEGKDIRDAFSDVKASVKPKKLGTLDVVNAESDEEADLDRKRRETQLEIYNIKQQREDDRGFLEEFDDRLDGVKKNVDVVEEDIVKQKEELGEQAQEETEEKESAEQEETETQEEDTNKEAEDEETENTDEAPEEKETQEEPGELEKKESQEETQAGIEDPQALAQKINAEIDQLSKDNPSEEEDKKE